MALESNVNPNPNPQPPAPSPEPLNTPPAPLQDNEAIQAAIEKARLEERTKLYATINDEKKKVESLTATLTDVQRKNTEMKTNLKALEKARTEKGEVDVAKLVEEVSLNAANRVIEETSSTITELKSRLEQAEIRQTQAELELYKKEAIAKIGEGNIIVALVNGKTREEIDSSIQVAKSEMQKILLRVAPGSSATSVAPSNTANGNGNQGGASSVPPVLPQGNGRAGTADGSLQSVRSLNPRDYKLQREKIMADLKSRHG